MQTVLNPKKTGLFGSWKNWGGGGAFRAPPLRSRPWIARSPQKLHNGSVRCNLQDCIFRFSKIVFFYFILINYANLCEKSVNNAPKMLIFGLNTLCGIPSNCT